MLFMRLRCAAVLLLSLVSAAAYAQTVHTITPSSGPVSGGQEVTVTGNFGFWPYGLIFGTVHVPATRVDEHTLRAITPPHPAGTVPVTIFEYDIGINTDLTYTFEGDSTTAFDRVLLPIFLPPVFGRNGSEFRTDFVAYNSGESPILAYGLQWSCGSVGCSEEDLSFYIAERSEAGGESVVRNGAPGRFVLVPRSASNDLHMQLRAYDVSREATNFGTEIPIVHADEMRSDPVVFLDVPTDPRFRNMLRIYSSHVGRVRVTIEGAGNYRSEQSIHLAGKSDPYDPGYAAFTEFPVGSGAVRVTVDLPADGGPDPSPAAPDVWAFITVTNNETQHITVISPQR
jgi:hypothetical protein